MQSPSERPSPLELRRDQRGLVFEPVGASQLAGQRNCHVVLTRPGAVRGNHWHRRATEIAVVLGPARVRARRDADVEEVLVPEGEVYRFVFPPGLAHAIQNTGTSPLLVVAFTDQIHDPEHPDVVPEVLIEPTL